MEDRLSIKAAVFVVLERDGKIFMLRRSNTGWGDGKWTVPSGHVEKGQTIVAAAQAEAFEETTVTIAAEDLEFLHTQYLLDRYANYYFKATKWEGEPEIGEPHLASECGWFSYEKIPEDTIVQILEVLNEVKEGNYFSDMTKDPNPQRISVRIDT